MAETTVPTTTREESAVPSTREESRYLAPPVDIFETEDQITVIADLPGVSKENVDIRVENGVLTIKGAVEHTSPGESLYREFELARYYRQFQLSDEVDVEKISAECKNGVLTVALPKRESSKPRQIEVKVA